MAFGDSSLIAPMLLACIGGYLLGSVPFGVLVSKWLEAADPRKTGSRNVGFTNVLRTSGLRAGVLTLIGDMGKGWFVGWLATKLFQDEAFVLLVAATPVLGHVFSIFLNFRGGKGVATALGSLVGVDPLATTGWRFSRCGRKVTSVSR